jgi:cell division protein FtsQ
MPGVNMKRAVGTRRSTMNKRRRGALSVIVPWTRRFGFLLCAGVLGFSLGIWMFMGGYQSTQAYTHDKMLAITSAMGFKVKNVLVEGRVHANADALKALTGVGYGSPLFSFDPPAVKKDIETLAWVKNAEVGRRFPDTVYIRLQEHTPLALWQKDNTLHLLSEEGKIIGMPHLGRFRELMIVMGEGAPENTPQLFANLRTRPILASHITTAKWMDGRRWDLLLKEGITVRLPEGNTGRALQQLADAQSEGLFKKDITMIDLREPDRMIVRTRPGAVEEFKAQQAALVAGDNI